MCKNFREKGTCKYGDRCLFAHGDHELTKRGSPDSEKSIDKKAVETVLEVVAEATIETTKDSTKLQIESSETESSKLAINKNDSGEQSQSCSVESSGIQNASAEEEIQDHGENSTTLSENCSQNATPEKKVGKATTPPSGKGEQYHANFECFKKEEEFKKLFDDLDIENIVLNTNQDTENETAQKFNIEIEKLLSDDGDDQSLDVPDYKQRRQSENISNEKQFSEQSLKMPASDNSSSNGLFPLIE